jgi:hypothetical protein
MHGLRSRFKVTAERLWLALVRQYGPIGLLGIALLLASGAVALLLTPQLQERSVALEEELGQAARAAVASQRPRTPGETVLPSDVLPEITTNAADMSRLYELAATNHISTPKAAYRLTPVAASWYLAYEVRLPVTANYVALRRFTADALNQLPNLAIDGIRLSRLDATTDSVDAELRLTLFYRKPQP